MTELVRIEGLIAAQVIVWLTSCDAAALTPDSVDGHYGLLRGLLMGL